MTQSRGSVDRGEGREDTVTVGHGSEDDPDLRKSQAQRLFEFEMWTNESTLRDLEYSHRRTEKKQRRRERRKDYRKRCWKKVYLPAILAMVVGTFLTLCATLQSLAGDTFLWNARSVLMVLGPTLLGLGFLALMMAAGCTFKHDQEVRHKPTSPPGFLVNGFQYSRPSTDLRSDSVITADLSLPADLDPAKNYVEGGSQSGKRTRTRSVSRDDSVHSDCPLTAHHSYSSTASWVRCVSAVHSHRQRSSPTRQSSDSHHPAPPPVHSRHPQQARPSLESADQDHSGSQTDLHVVRTRSVTSSGYQSASDSTCGTAEYQLCCENTHGHRNNSSYIQLRHNVRHPPNHLVTKYSAKESEMSERNQTQNGSVRSSVGTDAQQSCHTLDQCTPKLITPQKTDTSIPEAFIRPVILQQETKCPDRS